MSRIHTQRDKALNPDNFFNTITNSIETYQYLMDETGFLECKTSHLPSVKPMLQTEATIKVRYQSKV